MSDKRAGSLTDNGSSSHDSKQELPVPIHPDDARDKVFTAIMKALLKLGNKPSSPKELANVIMKYKYATLGGATPFATVSSRISQHFKRAAAHNPPRPPLLAKHYDERHSRKINYSLATEPPSSGNDALLSDTSLSSEDESAMTPASSRPSHHQSPASSITTATTTTTTTTPPTTRSTRNRTRRQRQLEEEEEEEQRQRNNKRMRHHHFEHHHYPHPSMLPLSPVTPSSSSSSSSSGSFSSYSPSSSAAVVDKQKMDLPQTIPPVSPPTLMDLSDEESEAEYSDYHEEMLKGDDMLADVDTSSMRRPSLVSSRRPSIAQVTVSDNYNPRNNSISSSSSSSRRPSFNHNGGDDLWDATNYEHDFSSVFLSDDATASPFNIGAPESISVAELEAYFNGNNGNNNSNSNNNNNNHYHLPASSSSPSSSTTGSSRSASSRKSFSALMGSKETSLLQRALLASTAAARGMADTASTTSATMDQPEEEFEEQQQPARPRRKSWPEEGATSGASLFSDEDEQVYTTPPSNVDEMKDEPLPAKNEDDDEQQQPRSQQTRRQSTQWPTPKKDDSYNIQKKTLGALECYQLDLIKEDTKVLRFIASTDGATEHVALRTRHAADHAKDRKNSQHFYLGEGYVNATQMRKVARSTLGKGHFDAASESSEGKVVVTLTKGPMDCRGTWVPLSRARELLSEFKLDECQGLVKLLSDDPLDEQENQVPPVTMATDPPPDNQALSCTTDDDPIDDEAFVKFEDDDDKRITDSTNTVTNIDSFVAPNIPALPLKADIKPEPNGSIDLLKALNLQDGSPEHQPSSMPDMTKLLTTYLQSLSSTNNLTVEFKAALSRFPALEALLRKDTTSLGTENDHVNTSTTTTTTTEHVVHTTTPTNPSMYITVVDNIAVCVAVLAPTETVPECRIMRRLDTNYINGTILLTAGGIETESERSMILSFEMDRRRVPKQKSGLYGTWIPLRRAQELAVTHSIQHRLGVFLSDNIEKFFPSPLPITITRRSPSTTTKADNHSSLALQALRNPNKHHPTTTPSPSPLTTSATQIHQLLLSHNSRQLAEYAQKAPLLGTFDDYDDKRKVSVIDSASVASRMALASKRKKKQQRTRKRPEDDGSDVDIVNSGSEADDDDDDDDGGETDTDHDVEEVRRRKKRMRDAAIEAMESGSSMDLEELLRRASSPIMGGNHRNNNHSHNMDPRLISAAAAHEKMRSKVTSARRRPQMQSGGGGGGKIAPSKMKRSATWSGSMSSPPLRVVVPNKRPLQPTKKQNGVTRPSKLRNSSISSDDDNRVVEHAPTTPTTSTAVSSNKNNNNNMTSTTLSTTTTTTTTNEATLTTIKEDEEDEDEEIDIGGSDRDDDLR